MSGIISHKGTVDCTQGQTVRVRITQSSACASCKVASHCTSAESKEKLIDVACANASEYRVGQEVSVMAASSVGAKAVLLAFAAPTVLLLGVITGCLVAGTSELTAALAGIVALLPYYVGLWMCRRRLTKTLVFWIE